MSTENNTQRSRYLLPVLLACASLTVMAGDTVTALLWIALVLAMRALVVSGAIKAFGITIPLNIDSGAVALLVSIVLFVSVSLFGSRPNTSLSVGSHSDKWAE